MKLIYPRYFQADSVLDKYIVVLGFAKEGYNRVSIYAGYR